MTACIDDERREVARRLREVQADVIPGTKTEVHPIAGRIIGVACGYDLPDFQGLLGYLADLIDPTCLARADVEDTPDGGQFECWSCSVCGNIFSVDPDYDTETDGPAYCEACGHRIVGKGEPTWL